ncbi:MAG: polysaccharide biosynthesis tyrosine autokinase [Dehalococcoidia bacterium]
MELTRYLRFVQRWWWLMVLGVTLGALTGYGVSHLLTPTYRSTATLLVNETQVPGTIAYNDILTSERLTKTYRELITKRPILEQVIEEQGLTMRPGELEKMMDVAVVRDTQLLLLSVEHEDPQQAQVLANALAYAFIESNTEDRLSRPGSVSVVEAGELPDSPVNPRIALNTALAALAGLAIAVGVALLFEYLDDTVKTAEDLETTGLVALGGVARFPRPRTETESLMVGSQRRSSAAEAYKVLRTNVEFSTLDRPGQTLLVTSANPGEGKTTTTANLALAIAQTGKRVVVVDSDLRRPNLHKLFGLSNTGGLSSALLSKEASLDGYVQRTRFENLAVLTSGPLPPNPSELLSSRRLDAVLEALKRQADVILFDSPPALPVADASILASKVDGTILVVDSGKTRVDALRQAYETLSRSKTRVLGGILNKLSPKGRGYYYYHYYYGTAEDGTHARRRRRRRLWGRAAEPAQ